MTLKRKESGWIIKQSPNGPINEVGDRNIRGVAQLAKTFPISTRNPESHGNSVVALSAPLSERNR
jgi:hypothetical protein